MVTHSCNPRPWEVEAGCGLCYETIMRFKVKTNSRVMELKPSELPHCWPWLYSKPLLGENVNFFLMGEECDNATSKYTDRKLRLKEGRCMCLV